ncbi:MAG: 6-bladed beta-propeller [Candidatus Aminicenantes bacterium]|nr:6-bladed beta-propeller [Candidatus Aminicenantes bacterium]
MNNLRIILIIILVMSSFFILYGYAENIDSQTAHPKIMENPVEVELLVKIGSDKENEAFFNPLSFVVDSEGRIFILDSQNSRVQCFSPEGKFLFSFGRRGDGPGELSNRPTKIKILEDGNICIIDTLPRRINVYNRNGQFITSWKVQRGIYNDIELIDNKYFLSNLLLREDNKSIHIYNKSGKLEGAIGFLIEPEKGLLQEVSASQDVSLQEFFCRARFTNITKNSKKEIIFSQTAPYRLVKYTSEGQILKDVTGEVDFGISKYFSIFNQSGVSRIKAHFPLPMYFAPIIREDDFIFVPFLNKERDIFYIDLYDQNVTLLKRFAMPNQIADPKENESIFQVHVDKDNNLYCLISSREKPAQLRKYKLIF